MLPPGMAGVTYAGRGPRLFPTPAPGENTQGNPLGPITGAPDHPAAPAPGYWHVGGQVGGTGDGTYGADPRAPKMSPWPLAFLPRGNPVNSDTGTSNQPSYYRAGIQGFNDKLTTKDRHAYWDTGHQKTGVEGFPPAGSPNTYNDPAIQPPAPELRTVNRTVSYQKGSDATRNQDDLTRPYTWLGEQGSPWSPVYGGVPGLYQPYGTRGGVPYPIQSPFEQGGPGDGPHLVSGGPPHGLHTQTPWKGGGQLIRRYTSTPQMRPVRVDRPSNSPQAGQSYSQTVVPQGGSRVRPPATGGTTRANGPMQWAGRGYQGRPG